MSDAPLLRVRNLVKHYPVTEGVLRREVGRIRAVDGASFAIDRGETLGLVGESGCGKSTAARALLRLEEPTAGEIVFDGEAVREYDRRELERFRRRAQLIFQDPSSSFDPRMTVGDSIAEPLLVHGWGNRERRRRIAVDLLDRVGLDGADADRYPHELSGGQKQRIALARALAVNPDLLVADEPVSALDVSVQAEILSLLADLRDELGLAVIFISHDMAVVREVCDRVAVMYLGRIVECGPAESVFDDPQHPYTRALLASIPTPDPRTGTASEAALDGELPSPSNPPSGCRFHTRCPEIIQPDGYEFEQAAWRRVAAFRRRLAARDLDLDAARASPATDGAAADADDRAAALRAAFDLPDRLSDPAAEAVLAAALDRVVAGDLAGADAALAGAFDTPCAADDPPLEPTAAGWSAACHLRDDPTGED